MAYLLHRCQLLLNKLIGYQDTSAYQKKLAVQSTTSFFCKLYLPRLRHIKAKKPLELNLLKPNSRFLKKLNGLESCFKE
jgi:hypothetical protein